MPEIAFTYTISFSSLVHKYKYTIHQITEFVENKFYKACYKFFLQNINNNEIF